jgi:hypothetical protein
VPILDTLLTILRNFTDDFGKKKFGSHMYSYGPGILAVIPLTCDVKRPLLIRNLTFYYYKTCHFDAD